MLQQQRQEGEEERRRLERKRLASQHQREVKRQRQAEEEIQQRRLSERQERLYRVVTTRGRFTTVSIPDDEDQDAVDRGFSLTLPYPYESRRAVSQTRVLCLLVKVVNLRLVL